MRRSQGSDLWSVKTLSQCADLETATETRSHGRLITFPLCILSSSLRGKKNYGLQICVQTDILHLKLTRTAPSQLQTTGGL